MNLRPSFFLFLHARMEFLEHTHARAYFLTYAKLLSNIILFYFISHTVNLPAKSAWLFGSFGLSIFSICQIYLKFSIAFLSKTPNSSSGDTNYIKSVREGERDRKTKLLWPIEMIMYLPKHIFNCLFFGFIGSHLFILQQKIAVDWAYRM